MTSPFISICIPTFNRAEFLKKTLDAIVEEENFRDTDEIEIVVSDNCSTDNTPLLMAGYADRFPEKIKYIRQEKPIDSHFNFEAALKNGSGEYLKLLNDTSIFKKGMLAVFIKEVKTHSDAAVFITQHVICKKDAGRYITDINSAVDYCSFYITWISAYCFKRAVFFKITDPFRYYQLFFPHEDILFRILELGEKAFVINSIFFLRQEAKYNLSVRNEALIYGDCYIRFLDIYREKGEIMDRVFEREKRDVLFWHILPIYFDFTGTFSGGRTLGWKNYWKSMPAYHGKFYFYLSFPVAFFYRTAMRIPIISRLAAAVKDFFKSFTQNKIEKQ